MKKIVLLVLLLSLMFTAFADVKPVKPPTQLSSTPAPIDWAAMTDEQIRKELSAGQAMLDSRNQTSPERISDQTEAPEPTPEPVNVTLQKGDKGDEVKALQARLIELKYLDGKADGDYGNKTVAAVQAFQKAVGIDATGIADEATQKVLFASSAPKAKVYQKLNYKEISRSPDDYEGEYFTFSGTVLQVLEEAQSDGTTVVEMRIATKNGWDDIVYVGYYRSANEKRILEDDRVTVNGVSHGLVSYEAVLGNTITIPLFIADTVTVK